MAKKAAPKKSAGPNKSPSRGGKKKKKTAKKNRLLTAVKAVFFLVLLVAGGGAAFIGWCWVSYNADIPAQSNPVGTNALWARHAWVGERQSIMDYDDFCANAKLNHIGDIFVHAGPLDPTGNIDPDKYRYARRFIRNMHNSCPQVRLQAWLGQVEKEGGGPLDISNKDTRANIVKTATGMLKLGFDGIHYDIEPVRTGNKNFILLLRETKKAVRDNNGILSVAAFQLEPAPSLGRIVALWANQTSFWDKSYFMEVAAYADQIAVMMYDTHLPTDWMYGKLVEWETSSLTRLLDGDKKLFIGVPTYKDNRREDPRQVKKTRIEQIHSSIRGIRHGLTGATARQTRNFGAAVYCEWTTGPLEWKTWRSDWLGE